MLALLAGCMPFRHPLQEKTITLTVPHVPDSALKVESQNGSISVTAGDRDDVEVVAKLRMRSLERLDATRITTSRDDSDRLAITVVWPEGGRKNNEGCSFTITLPNATGVTVKTTNGRIRIAGLSGGAKLDTKNGKIDVERHQGNVIGRTRNGAIAVSETEGDIDLESATGGSRSSGRRERSKPKPRTARYTSITRTMDPDRRMSRPLTEASLSRPAPRSEAS